MGKDSNMPERMNEFVEKARGAPREPIRWGIWGAICTSIMGVAVFIYPSPISPLVVLVAVGGLAAIILFFRKPVYPLYVAIFATLLPVGLIPQNIHSWLNRSMAVLALVTWGASLIYEKTRVNWTRESGMMVAFLLWAGVTLLWAKRFDEGVEELLVYMVRFALFLVLAVNEIRTQKDLTRLMGTLAFIGWVVLAVSGLTIWGEGYVSGTRLKIMDINENELGLSILVALPGVLFFATLPSVRNKAIWKILAMTFLVFAILLISMSGSRGGAISLMITLLCFLVWEPTRNWGKFGLMIIIIGLLIFPSPFVTTLERFAGEPGGTLLGGREALWKEAWKIITQNPLAGVGIGNSPFVLKANLHAWEHDFVAIHNPVLTIWSETGILGAFLYLGVLFSALWTFVRQYRLHQRRERDWLTPYYPLIACSFLGYSASWIKGGGAESGVSYFLLISLLLMPYFLENRGDTAGGNFWERKNAKENGKGSPKARKFRSRNNHLSSS